MSQRVGVVLVSLAVAAALGAPVLAPHAVDDHFGGLLNAPPTMPHLRDDRGAWQRPFIYPWQLVNQLEQRYEQDRTARVPLTSASNDNRPASSLGSRASTPRSASGMESARRRPRTGAPAGASRNPVSLAP